MLYMRREGSFQLRLRDMIPTFVVVLLALTAC